VQKRKTTKKREERSARITLASVEGRLDATAGGIFEGEKRSLACGEPEKGVGQGGEGESDQSEEKEQKRGEAYLRPSKVRHAKGL